MHLRQAVVRPQSRFANSVCRGYGGKDGVTQHNRNCILCVASSMRSPEPPVLLIIGAGVIGLSTAMEALNAGHQGDDITIVADKYSPGRVMDQRLGDPSFFRIRRRAV